MVSTIKLIFTLAVMISLASSTYAIKCYQCNSLYIPNCGSKFDADVMMLSDSRIIGKIMDLFSLKKRNATGCVKATADIGDGNSVIYRDYYYGDISTKPNCSDMNMPLVDEVSCDVCTKDECNDF